MFVVNPQQRDEVLKLLHHDMRTTRETEAGCFAFQVGQKDGKPDTLMVRSTWASREAFDHHKTKALYQAWGNMTRGSHPAILHVMDMGVSEVVAGWQL